MMGYIQFITLSTWEPAGKNIFWISNNTIGVKKVEEKRKDRFYGMVFTSLLEGGERDRIDIGSGCAYRKPDKGKGAGENGLESWQ